MLSEMGTNTELYRNNIYCDLFIVYYYTRTVLLLSSALITSHPLKPKLQLWTTTFQDIPLMHAWRWRRWCQLPGCHKTPESSFWLFSEQLEVTNQLIFLLPTCFRVNRERDVPVQGNRWSHLSPAGRRRSGVHREDRQDAVWICQRKSHYQFDWLALVITLKCSWLKRAHE